MYKITFHNPQELGRWFIYLGSLILILNVVILIDALSYGFGEFLNSLKLILISGETLSWLFYNVIWFISWGIYIKTKDNFDNTIIDYLFISIFVAEIIYAIMVN